MNFRQLAAAALIGAATITVGVSQAEAARAVVTGNVNLRSGPGEEFRVVDRLRRGDRVEVTRCNRSGRWCYVERRGRDGWVSSRFLSDRYRPGRPGGGGHWGGGHRPGGICFHGAHGRVCLTP